MSFFVWLFVLLFVWLFVLLYVRLLLWLFVWLYALASKLVILCRLWMFSTKLFRANARESTS